MPRPRKNPQVEKLKASPASKPERLAPPPPKPKKELVTKAATAGPPVVTKKTPVKRKRWIDFSDAEIAQRLVAPMPVLAFKRYPEGISIVYAEGRKVLFHNEEIKKFFEKG
jgi:hypothetical protein